MTSEDTNGKNGRTDVLPHFKKGSTKVRESTSWCAAILKKLEKANYKCALTGRTVEPSTAQLDHILPVARGGAVSDPANLQILHMDINRAKNTMTNAEFIAMCREVVAWADKGEL